MSGLNKDRGQDQFQALLDTVERLRLERFPSLDPEMVRQILRQHSSGSLADAETARSVEQIVEAYISRSA
jgi:hypothetical protein